ncbi:MAG: hypothetical protein ABH860_04890 [bacterium]
MPTVKQSISHIADINKEFIGTIAFRNEKLNLPDGSKVAIGIDGERWVIVYQEASHTPFVICEYNAEKQTVLVDKKMGGSEDLDKVRKIVNYFFEHAEIDDLVTIESEGGRP